MKSMSPCVAALGVCLALALTACKPGEDKSGKVVPPDSIPVVVKPATQDSFGLHLISAKWEGAFEENLTLHEDGTYEWQLDRENIACERGTFTHEGNKVKFIHKENCDASEGRGNLILGNAECVCEHTHEDPGYREVLRCTESGRAFQFGNASLPVKAGDSLRLQSVPCIALGTTGSATLEVRIRSAASADSSTVQIEDVATGEKREQLRKGEKFRILAKTQALFRIRDWEYPWYYIHVNDLTGNAWVYGRYIKEEK